MASEHNQLFLGDDYGKLETAKVLVLGAGAIGSNLVEQLAQEGYKYIAVVDKDRVDSGNPWTQVYTLRDNGSTKVQALRGRLAQKLRVNIEAIHKEVDPRIARQLCRDRDLVVDTFDNWPSRAAVKAACEELGVPCVHAGMSDTGYSEIRWNEDYSIPEVETNPDIDLCDYPLAGPLVHMTAALLQAVVTHFIVRGEKLTRSFTLRDIGLKAF